ncbi:MAG: lytic transglycosylase domain-containing protein [Cardiobacteriaceae bacterium]|nr:lytic transglycosylase domain-containing protein [Cardiobacteriaceae bacterium]
MKQVRWLSLGLLVVLKAQAQSLYVCTENGVDNIVAQSQGAHCRPYQKGMFGAGGATVASAEQVSKKNSAQSNAQSALSPQKGQGDATAALNLPADMPPPTRISTPESRAALKAEIERKEASQQAKAESLKKAQAELQSQAQQAQYQAKKKEEKQGFFKLKQVQSDVSLTEIERLTQEKIDADEAAYRKANPYSTQSIYYQSPFKEKVPIWHCPDGKGGVMIIDSADQPLDECSIAGETGTLGDKQSALVDFYRGKSGRANLPKEPELPPAPASKDVYKCFDEGGEPVYVNEDLKGGYKHCTFWSRSFAGVKQQFKQEAIEQKSLETLAKQGIQAQSALAVASKDNSGRLHCTGAGYIEFNGRVEQYHCANRSYDYTPGTSGGVARLGDRQVELTAHRLDYLNTHGSCGGTITAENGRVLHLEPTKDCPAAVLVEAKKVEAEVRKALNINVSGAFKERQIQLRDQINRIAQEIGVDPYFVHAIISAESAYKPNAKSHAGAMGLMQLMPATAKRFGVTEPYNTEQNVRGGTTYLKWLLKEFNGNMELAAAGYNAGEGNVRKYGYKIPPFIETKAYVPKVMEYYRRYRANPQDIGL